MALAALFALPAKAQDKGEQQFAITLSFPYEMLYGENIYPYYNAWDLYSGYEPGYRNAAWTPTFGVEYSRFVTNRIRLGGTFSWYNVSEDYFSPIGDITLGKHYRNNFYLLFQAKYCYMHTRKWQLYSGAGIGGSMELGTMAGSTPTFKPGLAAELVIFGAQFGPEVPFFWEFGVGHASMLYRFGLAYKF